MKRSPLKRKTPLTPKRKWTAHPKPKTETEELDALLRQIVLIRDEFKCQKCGVGVRTGRGRGLEVAHLLPKGQYPALRHELLNVKLMCWNCHFNWWHKNPLEAWDWLRGLNGENFVENLRWMARTRTKVDKAAVRVYLQGELDRLMPRVSTPI